MAILDILGLGASVASGGVFGLIGAGIGVAGKYFTKKQEMKERALERTHELFLMKEQRETRAAETENELAITSLEGSYSGLKESIKADALASKGASQWVVDMKAMFRPVLTVIMVLLSAVVFLTMTKAGWISSEESIDLTKYMIYSIFFTSSTCVIWWFGDRALSPPEFKHK